MSDARLRERRRGGYESSRPEVQVLVPRDARSILDLGCASGALGQALARRQDARVVGVELDRDYARDAAGRLDEVVQGSLEEVLVTQDLGRFDCVVAADVLEHLVDPWTALRNAAALLDLGGTAVVSVPNVRTLELLREVVLGGRWPRRDEGLFDRTHLRWFALADARELLEQAALEVVAVRTTHFYEGWRLAVVRALGRTPLGPFFVGQYLLVGRKRA